MKDTTPIELVEAGRLNDAVAATVEMVRDDPSDTSARTLLALLSCFEGNLERADRQLETLGHQLVDHPVQVAMLRQLLRAEVARRQFYDEGRVPEFSADPSDRIKAHLEASIDFREGHYEAAWEKIAQAAADQAPVTGRMGEREFDGVEDMDDLLRPVLEIVTTSGQYSWIPFAHIELLEPSGVESNWDLLWLPATLQLRGRPPGSVFLPTVYYTPEAEADEAALLGHRTEWVNFGPQLLRGVGQKILQIGEAEVPLLELERLTFGESDGEG